MSRVSPRLQKAAAASILCLLLYFGWAGVVSQILGLYAAYDDSIERSQQLAMRYGALAAQRAELQDALSEQDRVDPYRRYVFVGESAELLGATLQGQMADIISRSGGNTRSMQLLPTESDGPFERLRLRIRMTGDMKSVFNALHGIEAATPFLFVDQVHIKGSSDAGQRDQRKRSGLPVAGRQARDELLHVALDVFAYGEVQND